ncbi:hypothetical protein [Pseudanabaena sp. 'Roaring Creek']|uniref:hypothetical protein n=1 Tax=Pseudanabaena sp. 'Roaring Creek' TaxID=1681830 RepID=UPI0012E17384|nr:hypothetical protein [Pseudanabaena sp. 'Roaring Creek']
MADAHTGYWSNDVVADLVADLMALLVGGDYVPTKRVHTGWRSYSEALQRN